MPDDRNREPFVPKPRILYYGGASYEKSQMFAGLCQLAQRDTLSSFVCVGGDPSVPAAPLGAVFPGGGPGLRMRGANVYEKIVLCRFFSLDKE